MAGFAAEPVFAGGPPPRQAAANPVYAPAPTAARTFAGPYTCIPWYQAIQGPDGRPLEEAPGLMPDPDVFVAKPSEIEPAPPGYDYISHKDFMPPEQRHYGPKRAPPRNPLDWPTPIQGISSGCIPGGIDYDYLPRGTPVMQPKQPKTAMEKFLEEGGKEESQFSIGAPVRLVNLHNPRLTGYNQLIGDIVDVDDNPNNAQEPSFSVRVPLRSPKTWWPIVVGDKSHGSVPVSGLSHNCLLLNRAILLGTPAEIIFRQDQKMTPAQKAEYNNQLLPYLMVNGVVEEQMVSLKNVDPSEMVITKELLRPPGAHVTHEIKNIPTAGDPFHHWAERTDWKAKKVTHQEKVQDARKPNINPENHPIGQTLLLAAGGHNPKTGLP